MFNMKKAIAFLLALVMAFSCMPVSLAVDGNDQLTDTVQNKDVVLVTKEEPEQPAEEKAEQEPEKEPEQEPVQEPEKQEESEKEPARAERLELSSGDISVSRLSDERLETLKGLIPEKESAPSRGGLRLMKKAAGPVTNTYTGFAAFDITPGSSADADRYDVDVQLDNSIAMLEEEDTVIDSVTFELYHIHTDEKDNIRVETITEGDGLDVSWKNDRITGFSFSTTDFSEFVLKYTVVFHYGDKVYTCDLPGAKDIPVADIFTGLEVIPAEESASFAEGIAGAEVSNDEAFRLTFDEDGWKLRILKETAEPETLTVTLQNGRKYILTVSATGSTELATEDNSTVISTVNGYYLPEEAGAYAETLTGEQGEAAVSAVQDTQEETGDESAYLAFSAGLSNVDEGDYEGFEVRMNLDGNVAGKDFRLYRVADGKAEDITDTLQLSAKASREHQEVAGFSFTTDSFAEYVLCYSLVTYYTAAGGETYRIELNYGPEAGIPENAGLQVGEILPGDEAYEDYLRQAAQAAKLEDGSNPYARFFDIEIRAEGREIEPKAFVTVSVSLADLPETAEDIKVVHFGQDGPVIMDAEVTADAGVQFDADSFSVYGVIVTPTAPTGVYDLDGRTFTISRGGNYATANVDTTQTVHQLIKTSNAAEAAVWQFEAAGEAGATNQYYISTVIDGQKKYLNYTPVNGKADNAHAELGDTAQAFTVNKNGDNYRIYAPVSGSGNGYNKYLNEFSGGTGFAACDYGNASESQLTLTFSPVMEDAEQYMLITRYENEYYVVLNDGRLEKAETDLSGNPIAGEFTTPMTWTWDGSHLYHNSLAAGYTGDQRASDYYRRYIDPGTNTGLAQELGKYSDGEIVDQAQVDANPYQTVYVVVSPKDNKEKKITDRSAALQDTAFSISGNAAFKISDKDSHYLGIKKDADGTLRITGNLNEGAAADFWFADPKNVTGHNFVKLEKVNVPVNGEEYYLVVKLRDGTYALVQRNRELTIRTISVSEDGKEYEFYDPSPMQKWKYEELSSGKSVLYNDDQGSRLYLNPYAGDAIVSFPPEDSNGWFFIRQGENSQYHGGDNGYFTAGLDGDILKLYAGSSSQGNEAIYLAKLVSDSDMDYSARWGSYAEANHVVNHIDVSIQGTSELTVPLAYGTYKYKDPETGELREFTVTTSTSLNLSQKVRITEDDIKEGTIDAYVKNADGSITYKDNLFTITGYSSNEKTTYSTDQVRIEGNFKVADLDPVSLDECNSAETRANRIANKVYYTVSVTKPVTFLFIDPDRGQIYDSDGNPMSITVDMHYSGSFNYWDWNGEGKDHNNECPPLQPASFDYSSIDTTQGSKTDWSNWVNYLTGADFFKWQGNGQGEYLTDFNGKPIYKWKNDSTNPRDGYSRYCNSEDCAGHPDDWEQIRNPYSTAGGISGWGNSGMDFVLGGDAGEAESTVVALNITKKVVDQQGNLISLSTPMTNVIDIYYYRDGEENDVAAYDGEPVWNDKTQSWQVTHSNAAGFYNSSYKKLHTKEISVGSAGMSIIYDYTVSPGMFYIEESQAEEDLPREIEDTQGRQWVYVGTSIETEYVWRAESNKQKMQHVSPDYTLGDTPYRSIPDVLGEYHRLVGGQNTELDDDGNPLRNGFLTFTIYNIYQPKPINIQVEKTWQWQNEQSASGAPSSASVEITLQRYKLEEIQGYTANGKLVITDVFEGIDSGYDATYTIIYPNGQREIRNYSDGSIEITGLRGGEYVVTKTVPAKDGYSIRNDQEKLFVSVPQNGTGTAAFNTTVYTEIGTETMVDVGIRISYPTGEFRSERSAISNIDRVLSVKANGSVSFTYDKFMAVDSQNNSYEANVSWMVYDWKATEHEAAEHWEPRSYDASPCPNGTLQTVLVGEYPVCILILYDDENAASSMGIRFSDVTDRSANNASGNANPMMAGRLSSSVSQGATGGAPESPIEGMQYIPDTLDDGTTLWQKKVTLNNANSWSSWFMEGTARLALDEYDDHGYSYVYYIANVSEENVPEGTIIVNANNYTTSVDPNTNTILYSFTVTDKMPDTTKIRIRKTDTNGTVISGAVFELYKQDANSTTYTKVGNDITVDETSGEIEVGFGHYKLVEKQCPDGYYRTGSDPEFDVSPNSFTKVVEVSYNGSVLSDNIIAVQNTPYGSLKITKSIAVNSDADTTQVFTFAVKLTTDGTTPYTGQVKVTSEGSTMESVTPDDDGIVTVTTAGAGTALVANLPAGIHYEVTESVPSGWKISERSGLTGTISAGTEAQAGVTNEQLASLNVKKTVQFGGNVDSQAGSSETPLTFNVAIFTKDGDNYTKVDESKTINVVAGETNAGNEAVFDGLTIGTTYYVFEMDGDTRVDTSFGKYTVTGSGTGVAAAVIAPEHEIINNVEVGSLQVTKTVKLNNVDDATHGNAELTFYVGMFDSDTQTEANSGTVKSITVAADAATGTVTYDNLIAGSQYYVFETDASGKKLAVNDKTGTYFVVANGGQSAPITVTPTVSVNVANERRTGNLELTKAVEGNSASSSKEFAFTIDLTAPEGESLAENYKYTKTGVEGEQTLNLPRTDNNTKATITGINLKANDIYTIIGLPEGTAYTITELDYAIEGYSSTVTDSASGTIVGGANQKKTVTFTNTRNTGNLVIAKSLLGKDGDQAPSASYTYPIQVTTSIGDETYYVKYNSTNSEYELTTTETTLNVPSDTGLTIINLPVKYNEAALVYKVEEVDPSSVTVTGYTNVKVENTTIESLDDITLTANTSTNATLVNVYELTRLTISKAMKAGTSTEAFSFTVEVKNSDSTAYTGTAWLDAEKTKQISFNSDGKYSANIQAGSIITIYGLPAGCTYTVTETEKTGYLLVSVDGDTSKTSSIGTITGTESTAAFVNKEVVDVTVDKAWKNSDNSDLTWPTGVEVTVALKNGTATVGTAVLKSGETSHTFSNLDKYDDNGEVIDYSVAEDNVTFTNKDNYTVTITIDDTTDNVFHITNKLKPGALTVTKAVTVDSKDVSTETTGKKNLADGTYSFTIAGPSFTTPKTEEIIITNGTPNKSIVLENLVPGEYTITEAASTNGTTLSNRTGGTNNDSRDIVITVAPGSTAAVNVAAFTNNIDTTTLTVDKTVMSPVPTDSTKEFTFTVTVTKPDGTTPLTGTFNGEVFEGSQKISEETYTFTNGITTVTTIGTQKVTISGLPQDATYTVTETTNPDFNVTERVSVNGTLSAGPASAAFTNTRKTGSLKIIKTMKDKDTGSVMTGDYQYPVQVFTTIGDTTYYVRQNGSSYELSTSVATVFVTNGTAGLTIPDLPVSYNGTALTYTVKEVNIGTVIVADYTYVKVSGTSVDKKDDITISETDPTEAELVNVYERDKGSLSIYKKVTVNGEERLDTDLLDYTYVFTVVSADGVIPATNATVSVTLDKGKVKTATITNTTSTNPTVAVVNGKAVISNLPTGSYTVTENLTDEQENTLKITSTTNNGGAVIVKNNTTNVPTASFTNNLDVGSLKITKTAKIGNTEIITVGEDGTITDNYANDERKYLADGTYKFNVYTDSTAETLATKAKGAEIGDLFIEIKDGRMVSEVEVTDLLPGTYYIKETRVDNTTVAENNTIYPVTVVGRKTGNAVTAQATASVINTVPLGNLKLKKKIKETTGTDTYQEINIPNKRFPVIITVRLDDKDYYVQDETGKLGINAPTNYLQVPTGDTGLTINNLPQGTYTVTESNPGGVDIGDYTYVYVTGQSYPIRHPDVNGSAVEAEPLVNVYVKHAEWSPQVMKLRNGVTYHGSDFSFTITSIDDEGKETGTTVQNSGISDLGVINFDAFQYTLTQLGDDNSKDFCYVIKEITPSTDALICDTTPIYAKVTVSKIGTGENVILKAVGTYHSGYPCSNENEIKSPTFRNYDRGTLTVTKTVKEKAKYSNTLTDLTVPAGTVYPVTITVVQNGQTKYVQDTTGTLGDSAPSPSLEVPVTGSLVIQKLPYGRYTVTETNPGTAVSITDYTYVTVSGLSKPEVSVNISEPQGTQTAAAATAELVNLYERDLGSLSIEKIVKVNGAVTTDANKDWVDGEYSFTVTSNEGVTPHTEKTLTVTLVNGAITIVTGDGVLREGKALVADLPTGTYTVVENLTKPQSDKGISFSIAGYNGVKIEKKDDPTNVQCFNNLVTGSLKITKKVNIGSIEVTKDNFADDDERKHLADGTYTFHIFEDEAATRRATIADGRTLAQAVTVTIENGAVKTVTPAVVNNLLVGTYYIKETGSSNSAVPLDSHVYSTTVTAQTTAETMMTGDTEATPTNTLPVGSLKVTKSLKGKDGDAAPSGEFEYPIRIKVTLGTDTYYVQDKDGKLGETAPANSLKATAGEVLEIKNLPYGTYTVEEIDPDKVEVSGYTYTTDSISKDKGDAAVSATAGQVDLVNVYKLTRLTISKAMNVNTSTEEFSFTVEVKNKGGTTYTGTAWLDKDKTDANKITFGTDGRYTATVQAGNSMTIYGLPADCTYTVTESEKTGYLLVSVDGNTNKTASAGTISGIESTAAFVNKEVVNVSVDKTWLNSNDSTLSWPDGVTVTVALMNGSTQVDTCELYSGENPHTSHTFTKLDKYDASGKEINYTVAETNVTFTKKDDYTVSVTGNKTDGFHITNKLKPGALTITKTVTVDGAAISPTETTGKKNLADGIYSFTISGPSYPDSTTKTITITNGVADSVELTELVPGEYTITEAASTNGTSLSDRTGGTKDGSNGIIMTVLPGSTVSNHIATFTNNINTTSLTIDKTVVSPVPTDSSKTFSFTVKVTKPGGAVLTGTFGSYTFNSNGEATVTTTGTQAVTISGLPQGAAYVVTEATDDNYIQEVVSGNSGTLDQAATAAFKNTRKTGQLTVTKTIQSTSGETMTATPSYPIEISATLDGTLYYVQNANGVLGTEPPQASLTVTAGTPLVIGNLPYGSYTVTESNPGGVQVADYSYVNVSGSKSGDTVTVSGTPVTASLVNKYTKDAVWTPQVSKLLNGNSYEGTAFSFTIRDITNTSSVYTETVSTVTGGTVSFSAIPFTEGQAGSTFRYRIAETAGSDPYVAYDTTPIYAKVVVSSNNGTVSALGSYYSDEECTVDLATPTIRNNELGSLQVTKTVTGSYTASVDDAYPIAVKCGTQYVTATASGTTYTYSGLSTADPGYKVHAGEKLTFINLPVGTYTVSEGNAGRTGYTVTTTIKVGGTETQTAQIMKGGTTEAVIENHYRDAKLVITKTISGVSPAAAADHITIKVTDAENHVLLNSLLSASPFTLTGSTYSTTLKSTDTAEYAQYLKPDGVYTVSETMTDLNGYVLTDSTYGITAKETVQGAAATSGTGYPLQLTDADTSTGSINFTNTYSTPEPPEKQETGVNLNSSTPLTEGYTGTGTLGGVHVGDEITYKISYKNYKTGPADIIVTDTLDKYVEFVSVDLTKAGSTEVISDIIPASGEKGEIRTWTVKAVQAGTECEILLTVRVLEGALKSKNGPGKVDNGGPDATVQVGTDNAAVLDYVENPVPENPHKKEIEPYEGIGILGGVKVGEEITYEISYKNYKPEAADITIVDTLDKDVEFVSASTDAEAAGGTTTYTETTNAGGAKVITWTVREVPAGKDGKVTLTVKVLEGALESKGGPGKVDNGGPDATVRVGNDQVFELDYVENPVPEEPHKEETAPYEGNGVLGGVRVGDKITYEISYKNYKAGAADITIVDTLDKYVEFVSASTDAEAAGGTTTYTETVNTDGAKVITWTVLAVPAGTAGKVTLTVKVLEGALKSKNGPGKVDNGGPDATVQVGNDHTFDLDYVENPVTEPHKREIDPYVGNGVLGGVRVGDEITYEISYENYKGEAATVTIKDRLDTRVEYVTSSDGGKLADGVVTWTLADVPAGTKGTVTLTVKVLESALVSTGGPGKVINNGDTATVQVGNDKEFTLETVENPVTEPHKKETDPYAGNGVLGGVRVGDVITYQISYENYKGDAATVVIKDKLDPNVELVTDGTTEGYTYTESTRTLTWTIPDVASKATGTITLKVKVLEGALTPGKVVNEGATVKVGGDNEFTLETVENPVTEPHKREIDPYVGNGVLGGVRVGDTITYEISYENYKDKAATVTIKDRLDTRVEYVTSSDSGKLADGVVTWTLADVPAGTKGTVTLTVKVLESALVSAGGPGKVINNGDTATVQVGNDKEFTLETVENPVPENPHKKETGVVHDGTTLTEGYTGNGILGPVQVGDGITYEISYRNYKNEKATVVIRDKLDANVEYLSSSNGGVLANGIVTWTLADVAAGTEGTVTLTVKVLESALVSAGGPGKVINNGETATVKVGNDNEFTLETVENPVPEPPHKKETAPYEGNGVLGGVRVGDEITYEISYRNYKTETATVTIKDKLDANVEYVSSSDSGKLADGVVTWTLADVAAGTEGKVTLTVKVLEGALVSNEGPGKVVNGGKTATVQVGNDSEYELETVENPVTEPHKKEIAPYEGNGVLGGVRVGDEITYEISYENYKAEAATVTIKDKLDANVEYVKSSDSGVPENGVVTWTLADVPAGKKGTVTLTVKVLEGALVSAGGPGKVVNNGDTATVQVGNDKEFTLETVENPVTEPHKKEIKPYEGNGVLGPVKVGDEITYEISYENYKAEAADIVIRDRLDPNVAFAWADRGGELSDGVVTWTLEAVPAGKAGKVTLAVKVLPGAVVSEGGPGKVVNGGETATVKVGNDREFTLETVENPVEEPKKEEPHKKETAPYTGNGVLGAVLAGEEITYEISYLNYKYEAADIVIRDRLDPNVAFVSADNGGTLSGGTVTWKLEDVPAGEAGTVKLTVKVLESAMVTKGGPGKVVNGGETATVKVGNDAEFTLETVENPVDELPHKRETSPYAGTGTLGGVRVGEDITYQISYTNYKPDKATVTIRDTLDPNVGYLFASNGGVYDPAAHSVTWTIADVPAGQGGSVTLIVKVRESVLESHEGPGEVVNGGETSTVRIGNDHEITLETVRNPVPVTKTRVRKVWDDADDAAKLRPAVLKVTLSNGDIYYLSEKNKWTVTVEDLPVYDHGEPIAYSWSEQSVTGYTRSVKVEGNTTVFTNRCVVQNHPSRPQKPLYTLDDMPPALGLEYCINHVGDNFE